MSWIVEKKWLAKEFEFKNFKSAVEFINKILPIAEDMNHHPDILVHGYNKVKVMTYTHSEDKITDKDKILAEKIDEMEIE